MPTSPKGQKRHADAIADAVRTAQIATDEFEGDVPDDGKASLLRPFARRVVGSVPST